MLDTTAHHRIDYQRRHRRAERDACDFRTLLTHGHSACIDARVRDINCFGCSVHAVGEFRRDDRIRILLPVLGDVRARVAWTLRGCFGCQFDDDIDPEQYRQILAAMKIGEFGLLSS